MPLSENWINDYVFTVDQFFSVEECNQYIQISEDIGYEDALVTIGEDTGDGNAMSSRPTTQRRLAGVRNNQRIVFQNHPIANLLWERANDFVPAEQDGRTAVGCNEMLRFYRYDVGQQFNWHQDFPFERENGEISLWTLMVYLNENFEGGRNILRRLLFRGVLRRVPSDTQTRPGAVL